MKKGLALLSMLFVMTLVVFPTGCNKDVETKDFDFKKCFEKLKEFQKQRLVDQYICGVCVKVCPYGQKQNPGGKLGPKY